MRRRLIVTVDDFGLSIPVNEAIERGHCESATMIQIRARHLLLAVLTGAALLAEARQRGFPMLVWTVNGPQRLRAYLADGRVAGIITDLPGLALETRRELARRDAQEDAMPGHVTGPSRPASGRGNG